LSGDIPIYDRLQGPAGGRKKVKIFNHRGEPWGGHIQTVPIICSTEFAQDEACTYIMEGLRKSK